MAKLLLPATVLFRSAAARDREHMMELRATADAVICRRNDG